MHKQNAIFVDQKAARQFAIVVTIIVVLCGLISYPLIRYNYLTNKQLQERLEAWEQFLSTPMPEQLVRDLCEQGLVPNEVSDCSEPDVSITYRAMPTIFDANIDLDSTHDDVKALFDKYESWCENPNQFEDSEIYRCKYEFGRRILYIRYNDDTKTINELHWYNPAYGS